MVANVEDFVNKDRSDIARGSLFSKVSVKRRHIRFLHETLRKLAYSNL